ncbi:hypothetical protein V8G54_025703 [Vigna mungo]|uniref:Uncharacterized protein n=1 Tax=Vigna mungo TaxID=3915 RepID=A0AAQ3RLD3_VIGMU
MIMGLLARTNLIFSNEILLANPAPPCHVLILTPVNVSVKVQFSTCTSSTMSVSPRVPNDPMLIPWPGPHVIPVILILEDPALIAMQSSPVAIKELSTLMSLEPEISMPSVLGLFPGATRRRKERVPFWQLVRVMWLLAGLMLVYPFS